MPKRCAILTDLTSLGSCSMTVMTSALELLGIEACPLPSVIASVPARGFSDRFSQEQTDAFTGVLEHWIRMGFPLDGVISGRLASLPQVEATASLLDANPQALCFCDPSVGEGAWKDEVWSAVLRMIAPRAFLFSPSEEEARKILSLDGSSESAWCDRLPGIHRLVTGMHGPDGWGVALDGQMLPTPRFPGAVPGAGDLYDAIIAALVLRGEDLSSAVKMTGTLVFLAVERTVQDRKWGVDVTSIRKELAAI